MNFCGLEKQRLKLLVVAPSDSMRMLLNAVLTPIKSHILFAENNFNGLALAKAEQPDVIIASTGPHEAGTDLCKLVRKDPDVHKVPFVVLTTHRDQKAMLSFFSDGCDQIVLQPFRCQEIYSAISTAMRAYQESETMKIHVLMKTGETDYVEPENLNRLIEGDEILCFKRRSGVVVIGRDPIRLQKSSAGYTGPERREVA